MFTAAITGLLALFTPQSMLFMAIGVVYGLVIGILPGLGGIVAMALVLPFTFGFQPAAALALLLGAHAATVWGASITGILFNVPGAAKTITSVFDGYPMTQRGEGARALGASATAALLGGVIGAIFLVITIPIVRPLMLALGPSEYFMMAVWGLSIIATFSEGSVLKGLVAAALGILVAFIGMSPITGTARYTFGNLFLLDGINFPVAMIGLFAVSQMMKVYVKGGSGIVTDLGEESSTVWDGVRDTFRHWWLVLRSSVLGLWIGVLPGVGASVGGIAAYAQAAQTSRHPERFGKGAVEGVIGPDATLAATEGGGLLPTLAFGIPGGESMAILLAAFINMGIAPGRQMLTTNLSLVFTMVWIIVISNVLTTAVGLVSSKTLARSARLPAKYLVPTVLAVCFMGAYATRGRLGRPCSAWPVT
ncbi:MAG: tripartite tricarboxylate transporter permease [Deinococcales bacterium]